MARKHVKNPLDDDLSITPKQGRGGYSGRESYSGQQERNQKTSWREGDNLDVPSETRKKPSMPEQRQSEGPIYRKQNVQSNSRDVYVVRSISETDLSEYSWFRKLSEGIPLNCNNRYTLTLVNEEGAAHGTRGQNLNAVVFGKIEEANLQVQDRVQVKGKRRHGGRFEISKLYDYDAQEYIRINKNWRPVNSKQRSGGVGAGLWLVLIAALILIYFAVQYAMGIYGTSPEALKQMVIAAAVIILIVAYLVVTRFRILNSPLMQKIMIGIILMVILLYVPGGEHILSGVLIIWVLWKLLSNIFK